MISRMDNLRLYAKERLHVNMSGLVLKSFGTSFSSYVCLQLHSTKHRYNFSKQSWFNFSFLPLLYKILIIRRCNELLTPVPPAQCCLLY